MFVLNGKYALHEHILSWKHLYAFESFACDCSDMNPLKLSACLCYNSLHQKAILFILAFIGEDSNLELQQ